MRNKWLDVLKEEVNDHNTAAALREDQNHHRARLDAKPKTPVNPPSKTSNTPLESEAGDKKLEGPPNAPSKTSKTLLGPGAGDKNPETPSNPPSKISKINKTPRAEELGLAATWSGEFGFISLHDPTTGDWWDLHWKDAPEWSRWEAKKRKQLYKDGNRRAHRLTSREIGEIWATDNPPLILQL